MVEIKNGYKITIGRNQTHVTTYENLMLHATEPIKENKKPKRKPSIPSDYKEFNYYNRKRTRSKKVRELCWNNFDAEKSCMVTLTFGEQEVYTDYSKAYNEFKLFIKRINSHFDDFQYLSTFSRQKNGNWHFHILCNLDNDIANQTITDLWKNGYTYKTPIDTKDKLQKIIQYLIDNMGEASGENHGKHGYLASRNLEHNIKVVSYHEEDTELFDELFPVIENSSRKILYETKRHLGVQGEQVNEENGKKFTVTIPDMEMNEILKNAGYESWDTTFTHLSSNAKFAHMFRPIKTATPTAKKFKKTKI